MQELWKALDDDDSGAMTLTEFIQRAYPGCDLSSIPDLTPAEDTKKLVDVRKRDAVRLFLGFNFKI